VHTGFYSQPGTYKFREFLVYASKNFNRLSLPSVSSSNTVVGNMTLSQLEEKYNSITSSSPKSVIVAGDPQTPLALATVLGTLQKGYLSVFTGSDSPAKVARLLSHYPGSALVVNGEAV
jgi:hypothetical protein